MRKAPYWTAHYCFDLILFLAPLSVFFIVIYALGNKADFVQSMVPYMVPQLILFSFSFIGFSYVFSFIFQKANTAYKSFPIINLIFFYVLPSMPQYFIPFNFVTQYLMPLLSPFIAFNNCFFTSQFMDTTGLASDIFICKHLWYNYLCLGVQAIFYLILTLVMENLRFGLKDNQIIESEDYE